MWFSLLNLPPWYDGLKSPRHVLSECEGSRSLASLGTSVEPELDRFCLRLQNFLHALDDWRRLRHDFFCQTLQLITRHRVHFVTALLRLGYQRGIFDRAHI